MITDETVKELHLKTLKQVVSKIDCLYPILPGECSKSLAVYTDIQTFGGGVIDD